MQNMKICTFHNCAWEYNPWYLQKIPFFWTSGIVLSGLCFRMYRELELYAL
jgi:hypothetical protein